MKRKLFVDIIMGLSMSTIVSIALACWSK